MSCVFHVPWIDEKKLQICFLVSRCFFYLFIGRPNIPDKMVPVFSPWKNNWQKIIENLIKIFNWYVVIEVVESCHICRLSSTYLKRGPYPNERNFIWFIFLHRLNRNYNCFQQQKGFEKKLLNRDLINYPPRPHLQHLSSYVYLFAFFQKEVLKNIIIFINENKTHSWNKTKVRTSSTS